MRHLAAIPFRIFRSTSPRSFMLPLNLPIEPRPGEGPCPLYSAERDTKLLRGLRLSQSDEEAQFDHLGRSRIELLQPVQRLMQRKKIFVWHWTGQVDFVHLDWLKLPASLYPLLAPR